MGAVLTMATIVERVGDDAGSGAEQQPAVPLVIDDATLERLAVLLRAGQPQPPARSAWQTSLLVTLAGALIAAATAGYFSLRGDIASLGTTLSAEIASVDSSLRAEIASLGTGLSAEIASVDSSLSAEIAAMGESLRAELREFRAEFNEVALDHTQRLARIEAAHPHTHPAPQ